MTHTENFTEAIQLPTRHQGQKAVMPEVYSWLFPPVREEINRFMREYPMERFLQNINPGLDDAHLGLFDAFADTHPEITGLDTYDYLYPVSGSSEGIFHLVSYVKTKYPHLPVYALENEYKGYGAFCESVGIRLELVNEVELKHNTPGILFLSNPSARDGNILDTDLLMSFIRRHKTIVDLAYVGLVPRFNLDLTHPNILAVVTSLSKPFGLYYYRVGMMWAREEIASLYSTKWFKNLHGIFLGEQILRNFSGSLYDWAHERQKAALHKINSEWGTEFVASDVALLATAKTVPAHLEAELAPFKRGEYYRICVTPLMMQMAGDMQ